MARAMKNGSGHDDLLRQMAAARAALSRDAQSAVSDARTLADWKHHFRAHPWLFCGGAAAIGFLLVPEKKQSPIQLSGEPATADVTPREATFVATLVGAAATFAARQSLNYLLRRGFDWLDLRTSASGDAGPMPDSDTDSR
jgi:hypothetical protein